ncbi:MAG: ribonuclease HII [Gammaproteobacteria bacterium RIFCSPHIGHO2_12_FULL_38_14]|nr:MAG: ribonuclease HII [Gammaproteobacteria bacterium RIFCSPHIGHO2_12_FULL_38_14]
MSSLIAGVDEAGRGPLAGPVFAAAVILDPNRPIIGLMDSKKLSAEKRERLFNEIRKYALAWSFAKSTVYEIDQLNILQASLLAMRRAVLKLKMPPEHVLVDGNRVPQIPYSVEAIIRGDNTVASISAASIVAKVLRDRMMIRLDKKYPQYGFKQHKGYPTSEHLEALQHYGASKIHRRSFAPVAAVLELR